MRHGVLAIATCVVAGCSLPRADAFYIRSAALAERSVRPDTQRSRTYEERVAADLFSTRGHRVAAGPHVVLAYRRYSPGGWGIIDDEWFEKLTIEVPDTLLRAGAELAIGAEQPVTVRYSKGPSAWPVAACYGEASTGVLRVRRAGPPLEVTVQTRVAPVSRKGPCEPVVIRRRLSVWGRPLNTLSTWLGRAGAHPYTETYP